MRNSKNITLTAGTAVSHKHGLHVQTDAKKAPTASGMLVSKTIFVAALS